MLTFFKLALNPLKVGKTLILLVVLYFILFFFESNVPSRLIPQKPHPSAHPPPPKGVVPLMRGFGEVRPTLSDPVIESQEFVLETEKMVLKIKRCVSHYSNEGSNDFFLWRGGRNSKKGTSCALDRFPSKVSFLSKSVL